VRSWVRQFTEGRTSCENKPKEPPPRTSRSEDMIARVEQLVMEHRRLTVRQIAANAGISVGSVDTILHNDLKLCVYKWDKQKIVRLLYKLTDAHLAPVAQDAMKVSLAAQVMSHTAGATVNSVSSEGTFDSVYVDTGVFVDEVSQLFDSFNSNKHAPPFKE